MDYNNHTRHSFIAQVFMIFGADVILLIFLAFLFGDAAKEVCSIYQYGSNGLATSTLLQFLLSSVIITLLKTFFFSDKFIKNMLALWRTVLLLFSILISHVIFIIAFDLFSLNNIYGWIGFFICFGGTMAICTTYMIIRTKLENKKYNEMLSTYKDQHGGNEDEYHNGK